MTILTTIGFGDIVPANSFERVFAVLSMFFGALVNSVLFGEMLNLVSELHESNVRD